MYRQINASGKLTGEAADLAKMFGTFEQAHVDALTKALQGANYANIAKEGKYKFPTFDTQDNILKFLNTVEPVGVGAYTGAAKLTQGQVDPRRRGFNRPGRGAATGDHAWRSRGTRRPSPARSRESFTVDEVNAKVKPLIG